MELGQASVMAVADSHEVGERRFCAIIASPELVSVRRVGSSPRELTGINHRALARSINKKI